jgi:hypothetical protein
MNYLALFILFLAGCASVPAQNNQGISGTIVWVEGNRMPGPDTKLPAPEPVQRWVYVTEVIAMDKLPAMEDGLYPSLPMEPIDSVQTNKKGSFTIALPTGTYSLFTRENGGYFANTFDQHGNVNPVTVKENNMENITIEINYKAVY